MEFTIEYSVTRVHENGDTTSDSRCEIEVEADDHEKAAIKAGDLLREKLQSEKLVSYDFKIDCITTRHEPKP